MQPRLLITACAVLSLACGPLVTLRADEADDQFQVAAAHYQHARWALAVSEFREFLAAFPQDERATSARFFQAEALVQQGAFAAAAPLFVQLGAGDEHAWTRKSLFRAGECHYLAGARATASDELKRFTAQYPDDKLNACAWAYRGEIALADGELATAESCFATALKDFPDGPLTAECRVGLARISQSRGAMGEAREHLDQLTQSAGQPSADAHYRLATIAYADGDYAEAARCFGIAVEQAQSEPLARQARLGQARALYHRGEYDEATSLLHAIAQQPTGRAEAQYWLALTEKAQGQLASAATTLTEAVAGDLPVELRVAALAELAACQAQDGDLESARATYARFCAETPPAELQRSVSELLAGIALSAGDAPWAAELYGPLATAEGPPARIVQALWGLAHAQTHDQQFTEADATLARLLTRFPECSLALEANLLRGQVLEQLQQPEAAQTAYDRVLAQNADSPTAAQALWRSALLATNRQEWDRAAKLYAQLNSIAAASIEKDRLLYQWSWAARQAGDIPRSLELLQKLHSQHPDSPLSGDAACHLAEEALRLRDFQQAHELISGLGTTAATPTVRAQALYLSGQWAVQQEKWDLVAPPLRRLIEDFSSSPLVSAARYWIAEAAYRQGKYAEAADRFAALDEAKVADNTTTVDWQGMIPLRRAQLFLRDERYSEAYEVASTIRAEHPQFALQYEADYVIGRANAARGEFDAAREAYRSVIREAAVKSETAAMAQWMIGETYMHQREYSRALREYLKVEILYPYPRWQAAGLLQAAKCEELLGDSRAATKTYDRLLQTYPGTPYQEEATQRRSQLRR